MGKHWDEGSMGSMNGRWGGLVQEATRAGETKDEVVGL
ncbi:protein of unknown function [Hyphomicrobium sp. 1Nfss2.1]